MSDLRDINGLTLSRGDWIVYASRRQIRYARVVYVKGRYASILPVSSWFDGKVMRYYANIRTTLGTPPLRVQSYEVPEDARKAVERNKFYNDWFA